MDPAPSSRAPKGDTSARLQRFNQALLGLDRAELKRLADEARATATPEEVVEALVTPALESLGLAWEQGSAALSQLYMGGRLCEELVRAILPAHVAPSDEKPRVAIATLEDYHLPGKRLVYSALVGAGFAVIDYGRGSADELAERASADGIDILLVSTLMLPAALRVSALREALDRRGSSVRLVVGGAPFRLDPRLAREVGADAMGTNSAQAIEIVRRLLEDRPCVTPT